MKRFKTAFFISCLTLISFQAVLAQEQSMPPPKSGAKFVFDPPPNEALPIDSHIVFLVVLAVILGIVIIYKNRTKKASI